MFGIDFPELYRCEKKIFRENLSISSIQKGILVALLFHSTLFFFFFGECMRSFHKPAEFVRDTGLYFVEKYLLLAKILFFAVYLV